jgi:hypothetical protein
MRTQSWTLVGTMCMVIATGLMACGAQDQEDNGTIQTDPIVASTDIAEHASLETITSPTYQCLGWDRGARDCLVKCNGGSWKNIGKPPKINHGDCEAKGLKYCGLLGVDSYCWGVSIP